MAEQVNQRLEELINELEQMKRTGLYDDEDINEISRHRKRLEYLIQRHEKKKEDFVSYITYELTLLENITEKRQMAKMTEKKKDIEFAIASRVNRIFKQFIHRFQEVKVYFEYFKFCKSVGFDSAASGMIGEMLQMHGDKPAMWQLASKWEMEECNNLDGAREFLLKGIQRHPEAEILYMELFKAELIQLTFKTEDEEEKEKLLKRANVVWRNGFKKFYQPAAFLFECLELVLKYEVPGNLLRSIKAALWVKKNERGVMFFIAQKELEGCHWTELEDYAETEFPVPINYCIAAFEDAMKNTPEERTCNKYIETLLGLDETVCDELQKIAAVKHAWWAGYKADMLSDDMLEFGLNILKIEGETSDEDMWKILNEATKKHLAHRSLWAVKLNLAKNDENKQVALLQEASKFLRTTDAISLYNDLICGIQSHVTLKNLVTKFQSCDNTIILAVKPKLLNKMFELNGLKAARELYNELIKTPPLQIEVHQAMIEIEKLQHKPSVKDIRRCYECAVVNHGTNNMSLWNHYIEFEAVIGDCVKVPSIYRRAKATLLPELSDIFIHTRCVQGTI